MILSRTPNFPYLPFCDSACLTRGCILAIYEPGDLQRPATFEQIKRLLLITLGNKESLPRKVLCRPFSLGKTIYITVHTLNRITQKNTDSVVQRIEGWHPLQTIFSVVLVFVYKLKKTQGLN